MTDLVQRIAEVFKRWWCVTPPKPVTLQELLQLPRFEQSEYICAVHGWSGYALGWWSKTVGDYKLHIVEVQRHTAPCKCCGHSRSERPTYCWIVEIIIEPEERWEVATGASIGDGCESALVIAADAAQAALSGHLEKE